MNSFFGNNRPFRLETLTDFSQLSSATKQHLQNVYTCLTISMMGAAGGAFIHFQTGFQGGLLSAIVSIGLMLWLKSTANIKENQTKRLLILTGFGASTGLGMGNILDFAVHVNPQIIVTAFLATTIIFACFSLSALYAKQRSYLYLGGFLSSGLSILLMASLMNMFVKSFAVFQVGLYLGAAIFCGFILYDTQLIIEKHRNGDNDYIWHSVSLFLDFINLFQRLVVILGMNEQGKKKNKRRN